MKAKEAWFRETAKRGEGQCASEERREEGACECWRRLVMFAACSRDGSDP